MIFRCIVCERHWCAHDTSAYVRESLCTVHRRGEFKERLRASPVEFYQVKHFSDPIPPFKRKKQFISMVTAAAV